jgi:hypothetical protein
MRARRSADATAEGARCRPTRLHRQAHARRRAALPEFEALRDQARDIKNHTSSPISISISRLRGEGEEAAAMCIGPRRRRSPRRSSRHLPQGARRQDGHQGQVDDLRGDRPQRHLEANGIQPVETDLGEYIIQLRGERRATSSRRPCTSRAIRSRPISAASTPISPEPRPHRADRCSARRAPCCARSSSRPMSASPARIS